MSIYDNIFLSSSQNSKCFRQKLCRKSKNYVQKLFFFNRAVYEIMWKNIVERGRPQMAIKYSACALHAMYLSLQTRSEYVIVIAFLRQQW